MRVEFQVRHIPDEQPKEAICGAHVYITPAAFYENEVQSHQHAEKRIWNKYPECTALYIGEDLPRLEDYSAGNEEQRHMKCVQPAEYILLLIDMTECNCKYSDKFKYVYPLQTILFHQLSSTYSVSRCHSSFSRISWKVLSLSAGISKFFQLSFFSSWRTT